jgi:prevent-host-death family protein
MFNLEMKTLTIAESKTQLSALIEKVVSTGKPVTIGRAGKPMVQLVPYTPATGGKRIGAFIGKVIKSADYDQ